jgi:hypothetical protein
MSDFIFGFMVCFTLLYFYPKSTDIIGILGISLLLFTGGWNWATFAVKKGWIKLGKDSS